MLRMSLPNDKWLRACWRLLLHVLQLLYAFRNLGQFRMRKQPANLVQHFLLFHLCLFLGYLLAKLLGLIEDRLKQLLVRLQGLQFVVREIILSLLLRLVGF
jgi:hypothetical protein